VCGYLDSFIGAFEKVRKRSISFMSVRMEHDILNIFRISAENIQATLIQVSVKNT